MTTTNLTRESDSIIFRHLRNKYIASVNSLKYFEELETFKEENQDTLQRIEKVVNLLFRRHLINSVDVVKLRDEALLHALSEFNKTDNQPKDSAEEVKE